jgi:hypothetical protein
MTTTDTDTLTSCIDRYIDMWNEEDAERRAALIDAAWADDASYLDPLLEADGRDGLSEMVATVHGHYPGYRFRRRSSVDVHHDRVRFAWDLVKPDGEVFVAGIDVGEVAEDGRLRRITGFFGELDEVAAS